jgi:hypothetical protein
MIAMTTRQRAGKNRDGEKSRARRTIEGHKPDVCKETFRETDCRHFKKEGAGEKVFDEEGWQSHSRSSRTAGTRDDF